jgi:hypothetical protein
MLSAPEENHTSIVTDENKCRRCLYRRCMCATYVSIPYLEIKHLFQNGHVLLRCRIFSLLLQLVTPTSACLQLCSYSKSKLAGTRTLPKIIKCLAVW